MTAPADADLRARVGKALEGFVDRQRVRLDEVGEELREVSGALDELLSGGKRLRPSFCWWGARGSGLADSDELVTAAASLELLQACALVHDDVMDGSDIRRGRPAAHRRFATLHRSNGWLGDGEGFGESAAILLGDLCLIWAEQMLDESGLPADALTRARPVVDEMRVELMAGQYLDLLEQARGPTGPAAVESALRVTRYKSAKYTIERPLHLGAALAGAGPEVFAACTAYGLPLGEAFQLRDDVLGVFGDPCQTGKPNGDDLREGKRTVLVAEALARADPRQAAVVRSLLGDPHLDGDGIARLREVIDETGARAAVEELINRRAEEARAAAGSAPLTAEARGALTDLVAAATARSL